MHDTNRSSDSKTSWYHRLIREPEINDQRSIFVREPDVVRAKNTSDVFGKQATDWKWLPILKKNILDNFQNLNYLMKTNHYDSEKYLYWIISSTRFRFVFDLFIEKVYAGMYMRSFVKKK